MKTMEGKGVEVKAEHLVTHFAYDSWYAVLMSYGLWSLMYFTARAIFPSKSPEYSSRIITAVHGVLMTFYGLNQCFLGKSPFSNPDERTSSDQAFILVTSLGYFMTDLSWCLYFQTETTLMIAHHIYSCFALCRMLFKGFSGHQATCSLGALEMTNPLLQARWFIRNHGYHNTPLFTSLEITFMIMFILVRIVLGTIFLAIVVMEPKNSWEFRILAGLIYFVSWMFMINIAKYFQHKYMRNNLEADLAHINTS